MEIRPATTPDEIAAALALDEAVLGSAGRADYIASVGQHGGVSVAVSKDRILAFCCLDSCYFFAKPFISLLIVSPEARRQGLGTSLLTHNAGVHREVWTSTNRSNTPMRSLLDKAGWQFCGELIGLDEGDPERIYKTPRPCLDP